jgi:hypothetical protein
LERREESSVDLPGTVNSQTVDAVIRHEVGDPALPDVKYIGVFSSEVRK